MVKILGINGSARKGKNTAKMLLLALDEAKKLGCETELLELIDYNILPCTACNHCLREHKCSQHEKDDMHKLAEKLLETDGIIIAGQNLTTPITGVNRPRWVR